MHAHYHTISKLSRKIGPRKAVMKGLLESLVLYERIETTEAKAKALKPTFDKLVTKAKRGNLHDLRTIHAQLGSKIAAEKLTQELVHGFESRNSGYTRLTKTGWRRGDAAEMVLVELVLDTDFEEKLKKLQEKKAAEAKPATATKAAKTEKGTK
ncbi:MAG: large subunit ribosomal protein [Patescibacteria group bacterium]|nr:large subunit ribosomal protein [Patescibacteria group bacterium]